MAAGLHQALLHEITHPGRQVGIAGQPDVQPVTTVTHQHGPLPRHGFHRNAVQTVEVIETEVVARQIEVYHLPAPVGQQLACADTAAEHSIPVSARSPSQ